MSDFVFIILAEALLVLLILLIVLMVFNWKKKKKNAADIERLLAQVEESDTKRKKHLVKYLTSQLAMEEQPSLELVEDFIAAEKQFTQQFLGIHLNQQPISDFYQHSCEFVDKYLRLIAENVPKPIDINLDIASEASSEGQQDVNNQEEIEEESKESEAKESEAKESEAKETETKENEGNDIGSETLESKSEDIDSSETDQTPLSEAESKEEVKNTEVEEDKFDEEPDWGDAFAETGEEMDESLLKQDSNSTDPEN
jgi:hypothetical protein